MRKLALGMIAALAAVIVGCVEAEPDRTNVVIHRDVAPAPTTVIHDKTPSKAPKTNVNIDVNTEDKTPDVVVH